MIVPRMTLLCCVFFAACLAASPRSHAHGGVVEEDDLCLIKVSFLSAHFKIYQPRVSGHRQFCEDLPVAAESVFVMEYQHDSLSSMPIDFRIIRDVTGKGRFARLQDVEEIDDLDAATVFYQDAQLEPDVYSVVYEFQDEGEFIGIVTAKHAESDKVYAAVFPFEVGFTGLGYWPFFVLLLVALQLQYLYMSGRLRRWFGNSTAQSLILAALFLPSLLSANELRASYSIIEGELRINQIQSWVLHIEDQDGAEIEGAKISVSGGMPEHDHGLPTQPRVTKDLGDGNYRLEGLRFHMRGHWELTLTISNAGKESVVVIPLRL